MGELEPGTRVKTFRTDRDTLTEHWDLHGVVLYRDWTEEYESYFVAWGGERTGRSMMREEVELLDEDDESLVVAQEVMWA